MKVFASITDPELVLLLQKGAVGVLPTDTIYGLAARAADQKAVARLYALKNRERKPGTVIAADAQQLIDLGVDQNHLRKVEHLWPNSLSIILPVGAELAYLDQGLGLAARVPKDQGIANLLRQTGPLVTSSANHPGAPVAENLAEAMTYFANRVDFYVDGGELRDRPPSTLVRIKDDGSLEVLRQGAVVLNEKGEIA